MVYILNSPVLTDWGVYTFKPVTPEEAANLLRNNEFISAVGHVATAEIITQLLGVNIAPNRIQIAMSPGDIAIVFQLLVRLPEGAVLTVEEINALPYRLGLLLREA